MIYFDFPKIVSSKMKTKLFVPKIVCQDEDEDKAKDEDKTRTRRYRKDNLEYEE